MPAPYGAIQCFIVWLLCDDVSAPTQQTEAPPSHNSHVPNEKGSSQLQSHCTYLEVARASNKSWRGGVIQRWRGVACWPVVLRQPHRFDQRSPTELQSRPAVMFLYLTCCLHAAAKCAVLPLPEPHPQDVERHGSEADGIFLHGGRYQQHSDPQPWWGLPLALQDWEHINPHWFGLLCSLYGRKEKQ